MKSRTIGLHIKLSIRLVIAKLNRKGVGRSALAGICSNSQTNKEVSR